MLSDTGNHSPDQLMRVAASRSRDAAAGCCCDVESWASSDGEILVVRVSGELDMLTRPIVAATLAEAVSRAPRHLVVDLAAMTFCCARGFALLAETALAAATRDVAFVLSGLTAHHHHRVATMLLPDLGVIRFRSVADAVTAIRIDDTYRQTG
jgi:anti-anti-sigma factor